MPNADQLADNNKGTHSAYLAHGDPADGSVMLAGVIVGVLVGLVAAVAVLVSGGTLLVAFLGYIASGSFVTVAIMVAVGGSRRSSREERIPRPVIPRMRQEHFTSQALGDRLFAEADKRIDSARVERGPGLIVGKDSECMRTLRLWAAEFSYDAIVCHDPAQALCLIEESSDYFKYVVVDGESLGLSAAILLCDVMVARSAPVSIILLSRCDSAAEREIHRSYGDSVHILSAPVGQGAFKYALASAVNHRSEVNEDYGRASTENVVGIFDGRSARAR